MTATLNVTPLPELTDSQRLAHALEVLGIKTYSPKQVKHHKVTMLRRIKLLFRVSAVAFLFLMVGLLMLASVLPPDGVFAQMAVIAALCCISGSLLCLVLSITKWKKTTYVWYSSHHSMPLSVTRMAENLKAFVPNIRLSVDYIRIDPVLYASIGEAEGAIAMWKWPTKSAKLVQPW